MKKYILGLAFLVFGFPAKAENFDISSWKNIAAYSNVECLASDSLGRVFCGANGGVAVIDGKKVIYLNTESGLTDLSISALAASDEYKCVLAGTKYGSVEIIDNNYNCKVNNDILRSGFTNSQINHIAINGKEAYVAGEFGMAVYDISQDIFTQTVTKIADYNRYVPVNYVLLNDNEIYAAGDEGVAKADRMQLLQNPASWRHIPLINEKGAIVENYNATIVEKAGGSIYAAVDTCIYKLENDTFRFAKKYESYISIKELSDINGELYVTSQFDVKNLDDESFEFPHPKYDDRTTYINDMKIVATEPKLSLAFAYKENGAGISSGEELFLPDINSPNRRNYSDITTDNAGNLWLATGQGSGSRGFAMRTADGRWYNETYYNNSDVLDNAFFRVYSLRDGNVWFGNWGKGAANVSFDGDSIKIINYTTKNSPLSGYNGDANSEFTIASGFDYDYAGNLWFVNVLATNSLPLLIKMTPQGVFETVSLPSYLSVEQAISLKIDASGTKWLGSNKEGGLLYANETRNSYGKILASGSSLLSNTINSLAIDKSGILWIGTSKGLNAMLNPSAVLGSSSPVIRNITSVAGENVNQIYIDAVDNKWIATNNGIFVMSSDGTTLLANITSKNSPLESDNVLSITSFPQTGEIVIATDKSLQTAVSLSVEPAESYNISCYPQPFNPAVHDNLIINGLMDDNTLKIVTTEGRFVRTLTSAGGRAVWDGNDMNGKKVGAGVYLILASSGSGSEAAVGKIAVKR